MGGDRREDPVGHATDPPPRVFEVARRERSPGFGTPLAFPVSQWRSEWRSDPRGQFPVTVAGPRRIYTGFRVAPFVIASTAALVYRFTPPAARADGAAHTILRQRERVPSRRPVRAGARTVSSVRRAGGCAGVQLR